jgi:RND family efflux transporter MFP subunit
LENAQSKFLQARAILSRAKEALTGSEAEIRRSEEVVKEGEIALGYTKIRAPESGEVLKRLVEPGDLAIPGKPLILLQTKSSFRLEAYVREGLIQKVNPGKRLKVSIQTLKKVIDARVEEIVPYADPQTRTFLVKVILPYIEGLYPGMYGKLLIPVEQHKAVVVPRKAVRTVGQLELVWVQENNVWKTRFIKTGRAIDENVEVLSGLTGSEIVAVEE